MVLFPFISALPESVRLSGVQAIYSYDVLRADALYIGFYSGALLAIVLLLVRPSRWLILTGTACCMVPLCMSYAWTITQESYFTVLLATVAVPTTRFAFNPWVDRFAVGLVLLAGVMPALYTLREGHGWLSLLRFLEGCSLAVFPLPLGVYLFDHSEITQPVASQILSFPTNVELLYGIAIFLVVAGLVELLMYRSARRILITKIQPHLI